MKFKVGDKVKVIKCRTMGSDCPHLKKIGIITKIQTNLGYPYSLNIDKDEHWCDDELELVKAKQFTKSDLKDGDIVTYRNGNQRTLKGDILIDKEGFRVGTLKSYDDNLKHTNVEENSIIKVERPVKYETVFERKEEILDEAEKRYLRDVIRPFKDRVETITKTVRHDEENSAYIDIILDTDDMYLPDFKADTMYKNMEPDKDYTLKELGL